MNTVKSEERLPISGPYEQHLNELNGSNIYRRQSSAKVTVCHQNKNKSAPTSSNTLNFTLVMREKLRLV